jgi:hypothetical protein
MRLVEALAIGMQRLMAFPAYPFWGGGRVSAKRLLKNYFAVWRNMCIFAAANVDRFVMIATT